MNIKSLPFDAEEILAGVRPWVECESPSWDGAAVSRMTAVAASELQKEGAEIRLINGVSGWGDCVFADFSPRDSRPGLLILGHLDTVHPIGAINGPLPWRVEGNRCYGPGLFDMKSGIYIALDAYRKITAAGLETLPVRFLLTSDEESGSAANRALIETFSRSQKYVLVPEGAQPNGNLVIGRFPARRFRLQTEGKPSHALLQKSEGHSALTSMARLVSAIDALESKEYSATVTIMNGGQAVSTVPLDAYAEVVCTARTMAGLERAERDIRTCADQIPGCALTLSIKSERPLWTPSKIDESLAAQAQSLAAELGFSVGAEALFGGSDGNFTGALGVPTLDGLGPVGADAHQMTEHILIDTIVPRAQLLASIMTSLS